jgi:glycosyltransferase involved in cell wall biosynthesis
LDGIGEATSESAVPQRRPVVVYHVLPGLVAHVPAQVERMSRFADVHLLFEVSPGAWSGNMLDLPSVDWGYGVHDAREHLASVLPASVWRSLSGCAGAWYAVYPPLARVGTLARVREVAAHVRSLKPDIVHLNGESPRSALWTKLVRVPCVVSVHEPRVPTGARLPQLALAQRMLVPSADKLIVHSDACRVELEKRWGSAISAPVLAPLGSVDILKAYMSCSSAGFSASESAELRVALWGWIGPRKGIDVYIRAAAVASQNLHDVTFVAAGRLCDGYVYPELPALANGCRFEIREERLSNSDLGELVASTDAVALPYTDAMQSEVALTAFAFGKPVVGSGVGGLLEQVQLGVTGELFSAGSSEDMARALVDVLGDRARLAEMKAAVLRVWDHETSWEPFERGVRRAYSEVLGRDLG